MSSDARSCSAPVAVALLAGALISIGSVARLPALTSAFYSDDFHTLALARYIDNPLQLFGNHYPFSVRYRPVGVIFWWGLYRRFGLEPIPHHLCDLAVQVATALLLYLLALRLTRHRAVLGAENMRAASALVACLFMAHPVTTSVGVWLSTRFDQLSALFMLAALLLVLRYLERGRRPDLALSLIAGALGILAKEIGYTLPLLVAALLLGTAAPAAARARIALASHSVLAALLLLPRQLVLGSLDGGHLSREASAAAVEIFRGVAIWLERLLSYLGRLPSAPAGAGPLAGAAPVALAVAAAITVLAILTRGRRADQRVVAFACALLLLPAISSAPVLATYPMPDAAANWDVSAILSARFYYLAFPAAALLAVLLASALLTRVPPGRRRAAGLALAAIAAASLCAEIYGSRVVAARWAEATGGANREVVAALARSLSALDAVPAENCEIDLMGASGVLPDLAYYADVIAKSVAPQRPSILHCVVRTETAPWYHLVPRSLVAPEAGASRLVSARPATFVGNLSFVYLEAPARNSATAARSGAPNAIIVLTYDGHEFRHE